MRRFEVDPYQPSGAVTTAYRLMTLMLVVALISFPAVALTEVVQKWGGDETLNAHVQVNPDEVSLPGDVRLSGWPDATVVISDPTHEQVLLVAATNLSTWVLVVAMLWLLRGIAGSVREGDPFGIANVKRLRTLGSILVAGFLAAAFIDYALRLALFNSLPPQRVDIGVSGFELPVAPWLAGLVAFVLAGVFAYGLRLRQDVEATV
jgi:hypothetical protein